MTAEFIDRPTSQGFAVRGMLHPPRNGGRDVLVFAHGAGGNRDSALLVAIAEEFSACGIGVLRIDLPYRQRRPQGPPSPARAPLDRAGLRAAAEFARQRFAGRLYLGGQSYGGRQATMLAAADPGAADALFLTSYPLHPPGKPENLRSGHLPALRVPSFFVHGTRDDFGTLAEMEAALALIPAKKKMHVVAGGGHGLVSKREGPQRLREVVRELPPAFGEFVCAALDSA